MKNRILREAFKWLQVTQKAFRKYFFAQLEANATLQEWDKVFNSVLYASKYDSTSDFWREIFGTHRKIN